MNEINVERIMDEIRRQIPEQEEGWAALRFEDIPVSEGEDGDWDGAADRRELDKALTVAAAAGEIAFFRPLPGSRLKGFAKRVVRKLIRFCVEPICQDASAFHEAVLDALGTLRRFFRETLTQNRRRDEEISLLRSEVEELRERIAELERRA